MTERPGPSGRPNAAPLPGIPGIFFPGIPGTLFPGIPGTLFPGLRRLPLLFLLLLFCACSGEGGGIPPFAFEDRDGWTLTSDQLNRKLALVPQGEALPAGLKGFEPSEIVRIPAERVIIASGTYDFSIIRSLGKGDSVVGVSYNEIEWFDPDMKERLESGRVAYVGEWNALDFENILLMKPGLVLLSSVESLGKLRDLGIPAAATYAHDDNGLENRLELINFMGGLFGEREKARGIVERIEGEVDAIRRATRGKSRPTVSWGIYYHKKIFTLAGDFWFSELIDACGGDFVFRDQRHGTTEVGIEEFIHRSKDASVFFANILFESGVANKADYVRLHPDLAGFRAFQKGGIVLVPQGKLFEDSANLDRVARELCSVLRPDVCRPETLTYFQRLPD
ncbi:MAG: ABC transporter substrate-binding protein [Deltaproteobacteria bacterium]|nr:ABC transporter substrate-binding protein [Deltaproteobacteria bacterium]